jgi:RimJ/RimL family protein N-acetyltransferase
MIAPTLTTDRLVLRAMRRDDFDAYAVLWSDPRVTDYIGGKPRPREEAWRRFCQGVGLWTLLGYGYWIVTDRATGKMVGVAGLAEFERGITLLEGFPEAGWAFGFDHWGQGLASETLFALTKWTDSMPGLPEIRCIIDPVNGASIRVAERCGFAPIGAVTSDLGESIVFARIGLLHHRSP